LFIIKIMNGFLFFIFGLVFGSFINAVVWRLRKHKKIVFDTSECVNCHHKLGFWDLIPVLSFLYLRGKCRYCEKKISLQYPIVELFTGFGLFFVSEYGFGLLEDIWLSGIFILGVLIFLYDLKYFLILDRFIAIGIIWIFVGLIFFQKSNFVENFLVATIIFLFFFSIYFFSKGKWMGGGDSKLGFLIGLWLGWPLGVLSIFLASVLGSVWGLSLVASNMAKMKSRIPFGPFMVIGAWISYFFGGQIINWYFILFDVFY
jgi:prepilin signal peptidase PulO-like enzyme (type II secretory pathway)